MSDPTNPPSDHDYLKPCPFCGSGAEIQEMPNIDGHPNSGALFVICSNSMCMAASCLVFPCGESAEPIVREKWNKRPTYRDDSFYRGWNAAISGDLRGSLQKKCYDWGTYWRAADAHGVNLTKEQALEILRDALGVEVEISEICKGCNGSGDHMYLSGGGPDAHEEVGPCGSCGGSGVVND